MSIRGCLYSLFAASREILFLRATNMQFFEIRQDIHLSYCFLCVSASPRDMMVFALWLRPSAALCPLCLSRSTAPRVRIAGFFELSICERLPLLVLFASKHSLHKISHTLHFFH